MGLISSEILYAYTLTRLLFRFSFSFPSLILLLSFILTNTHTHTHIYTVHIKDVWHMIWSCYQVIAMTGVEEVCYAACYNIKQDCSHSWKSVRWHASLVSMVVVVHLLTLMYSIKCDVLFDTWCDCIQLSFIFLVSCSLSGSVWLRGADSEQLVMSARSKHLSWTAQRKRGGGFLCLNQQRLQMRHRYCEMEMLSSDWSCDIKPRQLQFGSGWNACMRLHTEAEFRWAD